MVRNFWPIWIVLFYVFFCNIIKVKHFCVVLLYLVIPYAYVCIESIDGILLSSFELKAILLITSVKTLCPSLLNLCCVLNIILLFTNSF